MALEYGVLRARPDLAKREDGGSTPHLQIRALDATGQPRRVAVNVQSDDGSATTTQSVHGWQLVDRNGRVTKLDAEIPAGASAIVALDGSGVQLGNNGGNLVLQDDQADQVDSVTYSAADAAVVDRYARFQR